MYAEAVQSSHGHHPLSWIDDNGRSPVSGDMTLRMRRKTIAIAVTSADCFHRQYQLLDYQIITLSS